MAIGAFMHDLSLGDAFRLYALLTIGDGLVAQIPALLLSSAAAIIVTRISDSGHFEEQVKHQMLASPSVLYGAAGMMLILGVIPGMPWLTFLAFSGGSRVFRLAHEPAELPGGARRGGRADNPAHRAGARAGLAQPADRRAPWP